MSQCKSASVPCKNFLWRLVFPMLFGQSDCPAPGGGGYKGGIRYIWSVTHSGWPSLPPPPGPQPQMKVYDCDKPLELQQRLHASSRGGKTGGSGKACLCLLCLIPRHHRPGTHSRREETKRQTHCMVHAHTHMHTRAHTHTTHMHTRTHIHIHMHARAHTHTTHMHTRTHLHMHAHTHTTYTLYTHTHTQTHAHK